MQKFRVTIEGTVTEEFENSARTVSRLHQLTHEMCRSKGLEPDPPAGKPFLELYEEE